MNLWVKDPETGRLDTLETLAIYSLGIVLFKFLLSEVSIGPVIFGQIDGGTIAAILTPTLGCLTLKKHSDNLTRMNNDKSN
jgi:hypothetical protein